MRNYCNFSLSSLLFSLKQLLLPSPFLSNKLELQGSKIFYSFFLLGQVIKATYT